MHIHFVAIAGAGMGSLAGLLKQRGHTVEESRYYQGFVASILWNREEKLIEGGVDRRGLDGAAIGR